MRLAVLADEPRAVDAEQHGQFRQAYIVHHLVHSPLQEGRIDADGGAHSRCGEPRGVDEHVLFLYACVEESLRIAFREGVELRAVLHRRRPCHHLRVALGCGAERARHDAAPALLASGLLRRSVDFRHRPDAVEEGGVFLRRLAALALLRQHVDEQRLVVMAREAENFFHLGYVVAVERAPVAYVELFENVRRQQQRFELLLYLRKRLMDALAVPASRALVFYVVLEFFVGRVDGELREVRGHAADARVYRHFVVVEDYYHLGFDARHRVERLERNAVEQRAVAYHRDDLVAFALEVARLRVAHSRGDGRAAVARREEIVRAFVHAREARDAALAAQRREAVEALRQQLVRVALMAHVEYYLVGVGVEYAQQRDRQLDGPERRAQVSAVFERDVEYSFAQLRAQRAELLFAESVEAPEVLDGIQKTHAFYSTSLYFVLWTRYSGRRTRKSSSGRIPASAAFAASDSRAAISRARSRP